MQCEVPTGEELPRPHTQLSISNPPPLWEGELPNLSDVVRGVAPGKIKWRSLASEQLKAMHIQSQHECKKIDFNKKLSAADKDALQKEKVLRAALVLIQEKTYMYLYAQ